MYKRPRKSASKWELDSERALIAIWQEKMSQLRDCRKNSHIIMEMMAELENQGFSYALIEIKTKMHNLTARYRKEKQLLSTTGGSTSEWDLFNEMESLLEPFESFNCETIIHENTNDIPDAKRKKKFGLWTLEAEHLLIEMWEEKYDALQDTQRNWHVFQQIADRMSTEGYPLTTFEVKCKLHNLKNKYRAERKQIVLESEPSTWPLFERVHRILGNRNYESQNEDSKTETTLPNFSFVDSDSLAEELSCEDEKPPKLLENNIDRQRDLLTFNRELLKAKHNRLDNADDDSSTQNYATANAKRFKIEDDDNNKHDNSSLHRLTDTVNDVVSYFMNTKVEKSRNEAYYKVLDSYLLQLPERVQDALKIEILDTVFKKINSLDESVVAEVARS